MAFANQSMQREQAQINITPLVDVLLVLLSPTSHGEEPRTANEIRERSEVLAFNAAFLAEMRSLVRMRDFVRRSIVPWLVKDHPVHRKRMHLIADDELMAGLDDASKSTTSLPFLQTLRDCGALAAVLPEVDALYGVPQRAYSSRRKS